MTPEQALLRLSEAGIPASPPEDVRVQVALAAERVDELHALGRSFHFELGPKPARVTAELRCLETGSACAVPLSAVLDVMSDSALPV